jgi:hypothetical protein
LKGSFAFGKIAFSYKEVIMALPVIFGAVAIIAWFTYASYKV